MYTIPLNDGTHIPWLAFGTGTALYKQDATDAVRMAIDNGIVHLDGAQAYSNEESIGTAIKASGKPRTDFYVVTKLKPIDPGQAVKGLLEESLAKLGVDYVDLFLIHSPVPANKEGRLKSLWKEMEGVKKSGLAKSIGVSNFRVEDLEDILDGAEIVPAVNQVRKRVHHRCIFFSNIPSHLTQIELHPYVWKAAEPIVRLSQKHGIIIASYGGQTPVARVPEGPLDHVLSRIQSRLQETSGISITTGQILTKWLLQKGAVVVTCVFSS
jgi:diketogulonate reductase-like aldo/keto reductase